jgi:hypothetical protein
MNARGENPAPARWDAVRAPPRFLHPSLPPPRHPRAVPRLVDHPAAGAADPRVRLRGRFYGAGGLRARRNATEPARGPFRDRDRGGRGPRPADRRTRLDGQVVRSSLAPGPVERGSGGRADATTPGQRHLGTGRRGHRGRAGGSRGGSAWRTNRGVRAGERHYRLRSRLPRRDPRLARLGVVPAGAPLGRPHPDGGEPEGRGDQLCARARRRRACGATAPVPGPGDLLLPACRRELRVRRPRGHGATAPRSDRERTPTWSSQADRRAPHEGAQTGFAGAVVAVLGEAPEERRRPGRADGDRRDQHQGCRLSGLLRHSGVG